MGFLQQAAHVVGGGGGLQGEGLARVDGSMHIGTAAAAAAAAALLQGQHDGCSSGKGSMMIQQHQGFKQRHTQAEKPKRKSCHTGDTTAFKPLNATK